LPLLISAVCRYAADISIIAVAHRPAYVSVATAAVLIFLADFLSFGAATDAAVISATFHFAARAAALFSLRFIFDAAALLSRVAAAAIFR